MATHDVKQKWIQNFREIYDYLAKSDNEVHFDRTPRDLLHRYTEDAVRNALSVFYAIVPERGHGMGEHDNYAVSTESSEQAANDVPPGAYRYLADVPSGDRGSENADVDDHSETQFASITNVLVDVLGDVVESDEFDNNLAKTLEILETKAHGLFESNIFFKIFSDRGRFPNNVDLAFFNIWAKNTPGGLRISSHFLHERVERSLENSDRPAGLVNQLWKFATKMTDTDSTLNEVLDGEIDFRDFVYGDLEKRRYKQDSEAPLKLREVVDVNDDHKERTEDAFNVLNDLTSPEEVLDDDSGSNVDSGSRAFMEFLNSADAPDSGRSSGDPETTGDTVGPLEDVYAGHLGLNQRGRISPPLYLSNKYDELANKDDEREDTEDPEVANINDNTNTQNQMVPGSKRGTPISMTGRESKKSWVNAAEGPPNTLERLFSVVSPLVLSENVRTPTVRTTPTGTRTSTPMGRSASTSSNLRGGSRRRRGGPETAVHTLRHQKWNKENAKGKK